MACKSHVGRGATTWDLHTPHARRQIRNNVMSISTIFGIIAAVFTIFAFSVRLGYPTGRSHKEFRRMSKSRRRGRDGRMGGRRAEDRLLTAEHNARLRA